MLKVCLVTSEIVGPFKNGGIGTHNYYLMQYLAELEGFSCTIIYNGAIENCNYEYWCSKFRNEYKAEFVWISPSDPGFKSKALSSCAWDQISQANLDYLQNNHFDIILFQEMLGGGFRVIQARRSLGQFQNTVLAVMVHSSWQWVNESMQLFPVYGLPEMLTKYTERYSVEHCDVLISPSQYMLNWSATDVDSLPAQQHVLPYLFDPALSKAPSHQEVSELIFFGRLEQRKGLILFLDSLKEIQVDFVKQHRGSRIAVYFLGRAGQTEDGDGSQTIQRYKKLLEDSYDLHIISDLGHHEALQFLRNHPAALVVCPSLQDNSPFAVIENILLETNLITCRTGGIPELFQDDSRLAEPTVTDLSRLLRAGLSNELPAIRTNYSIEKARQSWREFFTAQLVQPFTNSFVPSHNLLADAALVEPRLALLSNAAYSTSTGEGLGEFGNLSNLNGEIIFSNLQALLELTQEFSHVLLLGAEFYMETHAKSAVFAAIKLCPECILTSYVHYKFSEPFFNVPLGPCREAILADNILGNGLAIIPVSILARLDSRGMELMRKASTDSAFFWAFLAYLALEEYPMDVIPQALCFTSDIRLHPRLSSISLYSQRAEIINIMASKLPRWTQRLLPYIVEITPTFQGQTESINMSQLEDRSSLSSLLRYYWKRIRR